MNPYIAQLKTYLTENEPNYGGAGAQTIWEMLYWCYTEYNPINTEKIRLKLTQLNGCLSKLTLKENDQVMDLLTDLCLECEHGHFTRGCRSDAVLHLSWKRGAKGSKSFVRQAKIFPDFLLTFEKKCV